MFNPMTDRWENEGGKWMLDSSLMFTLQLHDADCPVSERAMSAIHNFVVGGATSEVRPPTSSFVGKKAKAQEALADMKPNVPFNIKSARWGQFMAEVLTRRINATYSDQGSR